MNKTPIELLAPAKNLAYGKVAINYGADAVYIGAHKFGARAAAGNSLEDIKQLVRYAHQYGTKVFVTLNTILFDEELEAAQSLVNEIYQAGADALIIQDMALLEMELPPIPLHASTQTNNYELERIQFLDQMGFERIILARELSVEQIKTIRQKTKSELEYFVHGALCVSLSGQCYFSQAVTGRSANRGECAQMCRHPYNLLDANGKKILLNKHLLSLKDLNLSSEIGKLLHAGVTSLKIEGRLKDEAYVKNIVSYYRQLLDGYFAKHPNFGKASSGNTKISFTPDPQKSFNRLNTSYFVNERSKDMVNQDTPKSMGKKLGVITKLGKDYIQIKSEESLNNGDGLCFIQQNELKGLRVEKVVQDKVFVYKTAGLKQGLELYRNYDHAFSKALENDKSIRKIEAQISIKECFNGLVFSINDEDQLRDEVHIDGFPEEARNKEMAFKNLEQQMRKSGNSIFQIQEVKIELEKAYFFRMSELNDIRKQLFEKLMLKRQEHFAAKSIIRTESQTTYPDKSIDFSGNIANKLASQFYTKHGVENLSPALESSQAKQNQLLMTTRYCIKFELDMCPRFQSPKHKLQEPLFLEDKNRKYTLEFDCKECLMRIRM